MLRKQNVWRKLWYQEVWREMKGKWAQFVKSASEISDWSDIFWSNMYFWLWLCILITKRNIQFIWIR